MVGPPAHVLNYCSARDEQRRNLKTANRPAGGELEGALLQRDICYPNNHLNRRIGGKSTDATAFRRSMVFNNGVLQQQREGSSPDLARHRTVPAQVDGAEIDEGEDHVRFIDVQEEQPSATQHMNGTTESFFETPYQRSNSMTKTSFYPKANKQSFQERERQREIDRQNQMLLGQLIKIDRDFQQHKSNRMKTQPLNNSSKMWTSTMRSGFLINGSIKESHAGKNKRNDLRKIDNENARMFMQLSKKSCSVMSVDKLKAEYERAKALKQRISKSRRAPAS